MILYDTTLILIAEINTMYYERDFLNFAHHGFDSYGALAICDM